MNERHSVREIAGMLADRAEVLCGQLLPAGRRHGSEWRVGSVAGEPGKSLGVCLRGAKAGVWADFALVAETTSFGMTWAEAGCAFFKITVFGHRVYTPYLIRPGKLAEHPNPIVKMAKIVEAIEEYAIQYEKKNSYQFDAGTVIPKISVVVL
ncbi:hypothetical protein LCGC14_2877310 [marine sediment metagenome]|uniref:Uncharacterized protein n=1 Tax=marine sediment metagenome TaxID=412755 RepID=A0A0F9A985_9ZZZZ